MSANAQDSTTGSFVKETQDDNMQKMLQSLVSGLNIILDILTIIVTPAMILASWLMSPDWTSGDLFQIRPMIHDLWVTVANVAYFIYAILLVFIALATIFNSDQYGYKQLLPKLALGIIMVPLTWWFVQFIISLATIVTASVINIPTDIVIAQQKTQSASWWTDPSIPRDNIYVNDKTAEKKPKIVCDASNCVSPEKFIQSAGGMYSSLMIYSFAIFKFQDVKELGKDGKNPIKSIGQLINQGLIWAVMFIIYGLLVIALIFMLMMRAVKLWFYAIFSPLMTLKYVLGDKMFGESKDSFELKEFIGLAFVPAIVGLALSFGLVIVSVMLKPVVGNNTPACSGNNCTITLFWTPTNTITSKTEWDKTTTTVKVWDVSYAFVGDVTSGSATGNISGALNTTGGIIGTIIIDIIALIFIWVAFMAAKGVSKVAAAAFEPFEQIGKKMGGLAMSLPKYAPIPGTGGLSVNSMQKVPNMIEQWAAAKDESRFKESGIYKVIGGEKLPSQADMINTQQLIKNNPSQAYNEVRNTDGEKALSNLMKNAGKEGIEHEKVFIEYMEWLKKHTNNDQKQMQKILVAQGMSDAQAKIIAERIQAKDKIDMKSDPTLASAWKATAGTETGKWVNTAISNISATVMPWTTVYKVQLPNNQTFQINTQNNTHTLEESDKAELKKITKDELKESLNKTMDETKVKTFIDSLDNSLFKSETKK